MADNRCGFYELRFWDLLVSANPTFADECCKLQDRVNNYSGELIDGICVSDNFKVCPFYLSRKEIPQE